MYNVKWDNEINGILLTDDEGIVPPRPVFYENINYTKTILNLFLLILNNI